MYNSFLGRAEFGYGCIGTKHRPYSATDRLPPTVRSFLNRSYRLIHTGVRPFIWINSWLDHGSGISCCCCAWNDPTKQWKIRKEERSHDDDPGGSISWWYLSNNNCHDLVKINIYRRRRARNFIWFHTSKRFTINTSSNWVGNGHHSRRTLRIINRENKFRPWFKNKGMHQCFHDLSIPSWLLLHGN